MTPLLIQDALISFLEKHLADFLMDRPGKSPGPPSIFREALPSSVEDKEAYPFIIVRWEESEDSGDDDDSFETFSLIIGVFGDDEEDGEHAASVSGQWAMVVSTRLRLLLNQNRILAKKYELQFPLRSKKPRQEKQQNRYHLATITTKWSAPALQQTLEA